MAEVELDNTERGNLVKRHPQDKPSSYLSRKLLIECVFPVLLSAARAYFFWAMVGL